MKISYKLVLDMHSHILKNKTDTRNLPKETWFWKKCWAGTYRLLQKPASTLYINTFTSSSYTLNQIVTDSSIISAMTQMTRRRTIGEEWRNENNVKMSIYYVDGGGGGWRNGNNVNLIAQLRNISLSVKRNHLSNISMWFLRPCVIKSIIKP